ncbi:MAG: PilZ domain-containing protein [Deltaproteobacteria bacterium]
MAEFNERRKLPRIEARLPVTIFSKKGLVRGETRNITTTGAYILCSEQLQQDEIYRMRITFAKGSLTIDAQMMWASPESKDKGPFSRGAGVFFAKINREDLKRLADMIGAKDHSGVH